MPYIVSILQKAARIPVIQIEYTITNQKTQLSQTPRGYGGEGDGTPLQSSCLEHPMFGGAWWAAVHGVAKSRTRLSDFTFTFHFHALEKEMARESQGWGSLVVCHLWGHTELDTTEVT